VILVSFDGFRPDYLDRFSLPNFQLILKRGARARGMVPVFPSLTFPNHYSLVTGLRPDRHGIVSNSFYDPARDQGYSLGNAAAVIDGTGIAANPSGSRPSARGWWLPAISGPARKRQSEASARRTG
jgi:predicted AlkP superfamily pyrophosphatase or phosphodiesterase